MFILAFKHGTVQSPPVTPAPRRTRPIPVCEPYDATRNNKTLSAFQPIQLQTHCIFARKARLWGSCDWSTVVPHGSDNDTLDAALRGNVLASLAAFASFARDCEKKRLQGFVFGAPGQYSATKRRHGRTARVILQVCICDCNRLFCPLQLVTSAQVQVCHRDTHGYAACFFSVWASTTRAISTVWTRMKARRSSVVGTGGFCGTKSTFLSPASAVATDRQAHGSQA